MLLAAWAALAHAMPSDDPAFTLCLFRRMTHHDCPTCGMTRALALLARGDVRGSLARHPLALPFAAEAMALWLLAPLAIVRAWRPSEVAVRGWLLLHFAVLIGVWVMRFGR